MLRQVLAEDKVTCMTAKHACLPLRRGCGAPALLDSSSCRVSALWLSSGCSLSLPSLQSGTMSAYQPCALPYVGVAHRRAGAEFQLESLMQGTANVYMRACDGKSRHAVRTQTRGRCSGRG